jgi:hypothetical protein
MWVELTGVDPGATSFTMKLNGGMDSYTVFRMHDTIRDALNLDHTNITGHLMLDALSTVYFKERSFSVQELMEDPVRTAKYVKQAAEFKALANSPEIQSARNEFTQALRDALKMYGMDTEPVLKLLDDHHELAYLRRDALRSISKLRVDQFLKGSPEEPTKKPLYNAWVHQFWNVNSLIETACQLPSGVTLSLVRDPDDMQSYFAFTIRNGGNLYLLSDVPVHAHPLQRFMARKPERDFGRRTEQNWFPYDLLNLAYDEDVKSFVADERKRRSLVPMQQEVNRVRQLRDLDPRECVWIVMMFDLIVDKFWRKDFQAESLSYTGQMVREERPLINAAERANLPVAQYPLLALPALSVADIKTDAMPKGAVGKDGGSPNQWLEDRYLGQVDPAVLNLVDDAGMMHYLPPGSSATKGRSDHENHTLSIHTGSVVSVVKADDKDMPFWNKEGRYPLHAMDPTTFGTREEVENNRLFLARHNAAKAIQRMADAEYHQRKQEIMDWWQSTLKRNADYLLSLVKQDTVVRIFDALGEPGAEMLTCDGHRPSTGEFTFMKVYTLDTWPQFATWQTSLSQGYDSSKHNHHCYLTGAMSTYRVLFQPQTAKDLAEMAGCEIKDMPDVLQHWIASRRSTGNHILDRIDPMAWALHDPWSRLDFRTVIHLSKRGMAKLTGKQK